MLWRLPENDELQRGRWEERTKTEREIERKGESARGVEIRNMAYVEVQFYSYYLRGGGFREMKARKVI